MSRFFVFILVMCCIEQTTLAQKLYTGIVVDSARLTNLPDVHIYSKRSRSITTSSNAGGFMIYANKEDTLVFSAIGYISAELPLLFEEDALFVMLREDKILLQEVIIKSTRLYPNKIEDRTKLAPKKMSALEGVFSPFDYFWSLEREKRKLSKIVGENNRTQTYRQVITDPDVKVILMKEYDLQEDVYYEMIVHFNQLRSEVHYFTDPDAIMEALHLFFEEKTKARK